MKVKAKHWVNYNGTWHMAGDVFTIDDADAAEMRQYAEMMDEQPVAEDTADHSEPVRRTRTRKPKD